MGRLVYVSNQGEMAWRPWWAIDYPEAEFHLTRGLERLTALDVAGDSRHLQLTDDDIFDYPWLFAQQAGRWHLDGAEVLRLREYVMRGGFLVVDDFHGAGDWQVMSDALRRAFPDTARPLSELRVLADGRSVVVQDDAASGVNLK